MLRRVRWLLLPLLLANLACGTPLASRTLKVCADPNNLPFSNDRLEGFENRLAELVAAELGARLEYTWWAQRRGFLRNTLRAGTCDLVMGLPAAMELAQPTRPYYRSTYVFVTRAGTPPVASLDDPALRSLRVGVHLIGDDYANAPPAHALARRGITRNVVGFSIYGDYARPHPPSALVEAVAQDQVDVAIVWGPLAGYFAPRQPVPLELRPVHPEIDVPFLPMVFDIAMAVRRGDTLFAQQIDQVLDRRRATVDSILMAYGVPRKESAIARRARPILETAAGGRR